MHMETIDQQEYDLQAAGEYVLLRSADGSIEMQGRQIPFPGDIPDVSINSAWRGRSTDIESACTRAPTSRSR